MSMPPIIGRIDRARRAFDLTFKQAAYLATPSAEPILVRPDGKLEPQELREVWGIPVLIRDDVPAGQVWLVAEDGDHVRVDAGGSV